MVNYRILRPATRDEWLELRKSGIGSSEIGIIARVSRFKTPVELYKQKRGLLAPEPETDIMRAGHDWEPWIAARYAAATGDVMDPRSEGDWIAMDVEKPYMRVSPDRIFWDKRIPAADRTYANAYIVECKNTRLGVTREDYPKSWFFQVQYQMGVMGIRKAVIAWFSEQPVLHFDYVEVNFNPVIFAEIERMITDFWVNHVQAGVKPEEPMTNEDASYLWPEASETVSVATEEIRHMCIEYNQLTSQKSAAEKKLDEIKLKVKTFMRDAVSLKTEDGKVLATWSNCNVADSFDKDRFGAEHPDLYQQYMRTNQTGRRMTFRKNVA